MPYVPHHNNVRPPAHKNVTQTQSTEVSYVFSSGISNHLKRQRESCLTATYHELCVRGLALGPHTHRLAVLPDDLHIWLGQHVGAAIHRAQPRKRLRWHKPMLTLFQSRTCHCLQTICKGETPHDGASPGVQERWKQPGPQPEGEQERCRHAARTMCGDAATVKRRM